MMALGRCSRYFGAIVFGIVVLNIAQANDNTTSNQRPLDHEILETISTIPINCHNGDAIPIDMEMCDINSTRQLQAIQDIEGKNKEQKLVNSVQYISTGILLPLIAIPGCILNIINCFVLRKSVKRSANTQYLLALSVVDLFFLLFSLMIWIMFILRLYFYDIYVDFLSQLKIPFIRAFMSIGLGRLSNALIIVLSVERFIAIRFPFAAKHCFLARHPVKIVIITSIVVFGAMLPNLFRVEYIKVVDPESNKSSVHLMRSDFAVSNAMFYYVYTYFLVFVVRLLPVFLVLVLNIAIIFTLRRTTMTQASSKQAADKRHEREVKVTRMLIAISVIFLSCITPGLIHVLVGNFNREYSALGKYRIIYNTVFEIFPTLEVLNSAFNFFVYVFMSENFRSDFLEIFYMKCTIFHV